MSAPIKIRLDTSKYRTPTEEDVRAAKQYILQREACAAQLRENIDGLLTDAATNIVEICYRYGVDPKRFTISSEYNADMMDEISTVMDELEEDILSLIEDYSLQPVEDSRQRYILLLWLLALGKGGRDLRGTLENYLYKFMKDMEAAIAALRYMGRSQKEAAQEIEKFLHDIYGMPEVLTAIRHRGDFAATYIYFGGVQSGAVGISDNGSTNVTDMGTITVQMAWMKEEEEDFEQKGAIGYYQLRGSDFYCPACDEEVGFHLGLDGINEKPYIHPHCKCYRIPIYRKEDIDGFVSE